MRKRINLNMFCMKILKTLRYRFFIVFYIALKNITITNNTSGQRINSGNIYGVIDIQQSGGGSGFMNHDMTIKNIRKRGNIPEEYGICLTEIKEVSRKESLDFFKNMNKDI